MATWQFDLHLLPESEIGAAASISAEEFDARPWWHRVQPPASYAEDLLSLLPPADSWHPETRCFGSEDGDRVDLVLDRNRVAEVLLRLDLRAYPTEFSAGAAGLAASWGCVMRVAESGSLVPANPEALAEAVMNSRAAAFVRDPQAFLASLPK